MEKRKINRGVDRIESKREQGEGKKRKEKGVGNGVLSHGVATAVPSALVSLTAGFGMGPGVPSRL
jgi:hypothetical protein